MTSEFAAREVVLFNGPTALVDDEDYRRISRFRWYKLVSHGRVYAFRQHAGRSILMHREILGLQPSDGLVVDHVNHNELDNRRCNLRVGSTIDNQRNRRGLNRQNKTGINGVSRCARDGVYRAFGSLNGKSINLGGYQDIEAAANARAMWEQNVGFHNKVYVKR